MYLIAGDTIVRRSLPKAGTLSDGRTVFNYDQLHRHRLTKSIDFRFLDGSPALSPQPTKWRYQTPLCASKKWFP
jgi:hypothetical protein